MRVFVSSTFRNLASYREVLRLALEASGHTFLGMEHFAAQPSPPLDACLAELSTADVYVGLIGDNYGSFPPGFDRSYTELEYNHACDEGIDRLIFVIRDDALVGLDTHDHDQHRRELLSQFRDRLMQNHTIDRFSNPHEVAWEVLAALRRLEMRRAEAVQHGAIQ